MSTTKYILIFIIGLIFIACNNGVDKKSNDLKIDSEKKTISLDRFYIEDIDKNGEFLRVYYSQVNVDTLYNELKRSDSTEVYFQSDSGSNLFLRKGKILSNDRVHAIILSSPTDTTYKLELFGLKKLEWIKNDEIIVESHPLQFDLEFADFNFDGIKDIYIQCFVSNGYALSRGHLLTIDKNKEEFIFHREFSELANITIDKDKELVFTEEIIWCKSDGKQEVCILTHKWTNDKLILQKRECPCEQE